MIFITTKKSTRIKKGIMILSVMFVSNASTDDCYAMRIGDPYGGGTVFWLDQAGTSGLIMANVDQGAVTWYNECKDVPDAQSTNIGSGKDNTEAIIKAFPKDNSRNNAAWLCKNYKEGGQTDWYLPSRDELNEMYLYAKVLAGGKADVRGILHFDKEWYWSSSECADNRHAWGQAFSSGDQNYSRKIDGTNGVRAIRAFNNLTIQQFNDLVASERVGKELLIAIAKRQDLDVKTLQAIAENKAADAELRRDISIRIGGKIDAVLVQQNVRIDALDQRLMNGIGDAVNVLNLRIDGAVNTLNQRIDEIGNGVYQRVGDFTETLMGMFARRIRKQ